jgi:spermidine/putrescine transport system permease protein
LYLPIIVLVAYSFNRARYALNWQGFTLRWYRQLFEDATLLDAAVNSMLVAVTAATLATAVGTLAAVALYRYRFHGRNLLKACIYILTVSPDIVMGISLLVLYIAVRFPLGFATLLLAHVTFCLPFVVITVFGRLRGFDEHIIEASKDLGATEFETFRYVTLPLALPAVAAGWLLSLTLSLDDVMVSFFVTGPRFEILPLKIYSMVRLGVKPEVNALCALLLGATFVIVFAARGFVRERRPR